MSGTLRPACVCIALLSVVTPSAGAQSRVLDGTEDIPSQVEELLEARAAYEAWRRADGEYRQFVEQGSASESEVSEFAAFVAELRLQVDESRETAEKSGAEATQESDSPENPNQGSESSQYGAEAAGADPGPVAQREQTRSEKLAELDHRFDQVGKDFDEMLRDAQAGVAGEPVSGQSNGGWAEGPNTVSGADRLATGTEVTGGNAGESGAKATDSGDAQSQVAGAEREVSAAGDGEAESSESLETRLKRIGGGRDDNIAKQLRESAEAATDESTKALLWAKYLKYKESVAK